MGDEGVHTASRPRSIVRGLFRFVRRLLVGIILLVASVVILLQVPFVSTFAARTALSLANPWPRTTSAIGSAGGSWLSSLKLTNIVVSSPDDSLLISIDTLRVSFDLTGLLDNTLHFRQISVSRPVIRTRFLSDGTPRFLKPFAPDTANHDTSGGLRIRGDQVRITDGELLLLSRPDSLLYQVHVYDLSLGADSILIARGMAALVDTLHSRIIPNDQPACELRLDLSGAVSRNLIRVRSLTIASARSRVDGHGSIPLPISVAHFLRDGDLDISAAPISYGDIHLLVPSIGPEGEARLRLTVAEKGDSSAAALTARFPGGGTVAMEVRTLVQPEDVVALDLSGRIARFSPSCLTGAPKSSDSIAAEFSVSGRGRSLKDFAGTASVDLAPSRLSGSGPLTGSVRAKIREGEIQAGVGAEMHPFAVRVEATVHPFEDIPVYDARGSISILRSKRSEGIFDRVGGLASKFTIAGRGVTAHDLQAVADLRGGWTGNPLFTSLQLKANAGNDTVNVSARVITPRGSLHAAAAAVLSDTLEYKLKSAVFQGISLAAFDSGLPVTSLSGSLKAEGKGTSLDAMTGKLSLTLDSSHVADVLLAKFHTEVAVDHGRVHLLGMGESDAGSMSWKGSVSISDDSPALSLDQVDFRGFDLGKILGKEGTSSSLNGRLVLHARARRMEDLGRLGSGLLKDGERAVQANCEVTLNESSLNQDTIRGGAITARLLDGRLETTVDLETSGGGMKGNVRAVPFARRQVFAVPHLTLRHLDFGALAGNNLHTDLSGTVAGTVEGDSLENATGDLAVDFTNSSVNAALPVAGSLRATIEKGRFVVDSKTEFTHGKVILTAGGSVIRDGLEGKIVLNAALSDSATVSDTANAGSSGLFMNGIVEGRWGALEETHLRGMIHGGGSRGRFRADTLLCGFSVEGRVLELDTIKVLTNVASVIGGGTLTLLDSTSTRRSDFSLLATATSLTPLEEAFGLDATLLHKASLSLRAAGPPGMTDVHCETNVDIAAAGDFSLRTMRASADMRLGRSMALESLDGKADLEGLLSGPIAVSHAEISVHSLKNTHHASGAVQFGRGFSINLAGSLRDDTDSSTVLIDSLVAYGISDTWRLDRQATIVFGPRLVVRDFRLRSGSRDLMIDGILDPNGEQDFTVASDSLNVENLGKIFGRPGLGGLIFSNLHVSGPAANPRAMGNVSVALRGGQEDLGRLSTRLDWTSRSLEFEGGIQQPNGGKLDVKAKLPVPLSLARRSVDGNPNPDRSPRKDSLDFVMTADGFDLALLKAMLPPQAVSALGGILTADIRVMGAGDSVFADGTASIENGLIGVPSLGCVYSGIQVRCTAAGKDLRVEDAQASSGSGILQANGLVNLKDPGKPEVDLNVTLQKFNAIQTPNIKAIVSGGLRLRGEVSAPDITGSLSINDSYYIMPDAGKLDSVEIVELTPEDYAMLQQYFGYTRPVTVEKEGPSAFQPALNVTLAMEKNTWFRQRRNPTLAVELQGSVQIERQPEQPLRVSGNLRCPPGRSYVGQFGRQFEVTEGEILLKGPLEETELHVNTEYRVPSKGGTGLSEVVIRMKVETRLGRFVFSLTSDPAMDESEILSYLATGQSRTGALANTGDQGGLAGAMALEQLVGVAGGIAEESMPLDVFQIRQDGARGITVVAGNYVSSKTYLGVRQPILLNQGTEDTYYDTRTQYEFEYQAKPWLFLNLQGGSSRTLLLLKARVAY